MKPYKENKDSGISWIGAIPNHWILSKVKFVSASKMGQTILKEDLIENGEYPVFSATEADHYFGRINNPQFVLKKGDIVIPARGNSIGNIKLVFEECTSTQTTISLLVNETKVYNKYLFYFFKGLKEILFQFDQTAIPQLTVEQVKENPILLPPLSEQIQIASFLDKKTALIDEIIAKKERLIEFSKAKRKSIINETVTKGLNPNVKMKHSGIEFLGEIPENWKIVRLKQIANTFGRIGFRGYTTSDLVDEGEGAITISPSNMKGDFMTFENCTYISWEKYEESPEIKIFNDDILMVKTGSTYGKIGLVKNLDRKATINPQILVFKDVKINNAYLFNLLRTNYMQYQVETNVIGSTIPTISQTKILNFHLPLPPDNEIEQIMFYIQNQMELIDKAIELEKKSIQKLKEYRQSLISEAVTGKIDVREWQASGSKA